MRINLRYRGRTTSAGTHQSRRRAVTRSTVAAVGIGLILALVGGIVGIAAPAAATATPSATCGIGLRLDLQLGGGIPLPSGYSNPTDSTVTFKLRMTSSYFFGAPHEVGSVTLPPRTGRISSGTLRTYLHTPMGGGRVVIEVTTNTTGAAIVGRCDYQLNLAAPPAVEAGTPFRSDKRWLRQVPIQLCAVEGSSTAGTAKPGQMVPAGGLLETLRATNDIWYPQAQVAFSTATDTNIPVIADNTPPNGSNGALGVLELKLRVEGLEPARLCSSAWSTRFPGRRGIPVVLARDIFEQPATNGVSRGPASALYVDGGMSGSGGRGDALCGAPVKLAPGDIDTPLVVLPDRPGTASDVAKVLAHELGHNLFLGHGNGLDDDADGQRAGVSGSRRYDEYCDPDWLVRPDNTQLAEEVGVEQVCSLMHRSSCSATLRPLQVETARGVARFIPGMVDGTPVPRLASP